MQLLPSLLSIPAITSAPSVAVALSGGIDSVVLLHLCLQQFKQGHISAIRAIHVHHNLSEHANEWATFCQTLCQQWSIPFHLEKVQLSETRQKGVERTAREARYQAFTHSLQPGECLLLGHHQNDQAETVLFRALRGSDPYGLSAIPHQRLLGKGLLVRPLLHTGRQAIETYARQHQLAWVEDDSNNNVRYDRNFIRQHIMPVIRSRWPHADQAFSQTANLCASSQRILDEVAQQDLQHVAQRISLPMLGLVDTLQCAVLKTLSIDRQLNLLKYWFRSQHYPVFGRKCLQRILNEMLTAAPDKAPCVTEHGLRVRRYGNALLLDNTDRLNPLPPLSVKLVAGSTLIETPHIKIDVTASSQFGGITQTLTEVTITSRPYLSTIEPFSIIGRKGRKPLKKWLNEYKVPTWIRDSIPLLLCDNQLVAIPGLFTNVIFSAENNTPAWHLTCHITDKKPNNHDAT